MNAQEEIDLVLETMDFFWQKEKSKEKMLANLEKYCLKIKTWKKHSQLTLRDWDKIARANDYTVDNTVDPKSNVQGVYYRRKYNKWTAGIKINKKCIHLGTHATMELAIAARRAAEVHYGRNPA